jgi:hypothetical protein
LRGRAKQGWRGGCFAARHQRTRVAFS